MRSRPQHPGNESVRTESSSFLNENFTSFFLENPDSFVRLIEKFSILLRSRLKYSVLTLSLQVLIWLHSKIIFGYIMTVLTCLPQSICSWNYSVTAADSGVTASVEFDFLSEQGSITLESSYYSVQHAWLSGEWSLESGGRVIAVAIKPNPLSRLFEVSCGSQDLILRAESPFTRAFVVEQDDRLLGTIQPTHPLTRRASINCSSSIEIPVQVFLFWLAVLMWKRAANNSGSAGGAASGAGR
jgi:hypothetical protein